MKGKTNATEMTPCWTFYPTRISDSLGEKKLRERDSFQSLRLQNKLHFVSSVLVCLFVHVKHDWCFGLDFRAAVYRDAGSVGRIYVTRAGLRGEISGDSVYLV